MSQRLKNLFYLRFPIFVHDITLLGYTCKCFSYSDADVYIQMRYYESTETSKFVKNYGLKTVSHYLTENPKNTA